MHYTIEKGQENFLSEQRPDFIKHTEELQEVDGQSNHYPGSKELMAISASFSKSFGLNRIGIHHELLPPGRRTSWPHCHSTDEEFVYVIEGNPDIWIDGKLYRLVPGDAVGFSPGTGISHTAINNTQKDVRLLVVGDARRPGDRGFYPVTPEGNALAESRNRLWTDAPKHNLGPHDGLPDAMKR